MVCQELVAELSQIKRLHPNKFVNKFSFIVIKTKHNKVILAIIIKLSEICFMVGQFRVVSTQPIYTKSTVLSGFFFGNTYFVLKVIRFHHGTFMEHSWHKIRLDFLVVLAWLDKKKCKYQFSPFQFRTFGQLSFFDPCGYEEIA